MFVKCTVFNAGNRIVLKIQLVELRQACEIRDCDFCDGITREVEEDSCVGDIVWYGSQRRVVIFAVEQVIVLNVFAVVCSCDCIY